MASPDPDADGERATRIGRPRAAGASEDPARPAPPLDYVATQKAGEPAAELLAQPTSELPYGGKIGRYLVLSVLGRGGMGVVYAAYDPVLDRKIAVKLLRYAVADGETEGRARMQREAQALGRLNHANVITVHDVGEHAGAMYIAMEIVEGGTLREWQAGKPWQDIVATYLAAARGVAAAHAASLVHRDLKPENVLIGTDGRVRVTDFGLARLGAHPDGVRDATLSPGSALTSSLTVAGAVMGTPYYMAPEQIDGGVVDARSDQFSLCLALWEAVYGEQPFPGTNLALRSAAMKADPPVVPASSTVPRAIGAALVRGLAAEPDARWPSLEAWIAAVSDELARASAPPPSRRAPLAIGLAVVAVLAVAFAIGRRAGAGPGEPDCAAAAGPAAALWTPAESSAVAASFSATGAPFATAAHAAIDHRVAAWRARWQADAVGSCAATRDGAQSAGMLDLRGACLARSRAELATIIAALAHADRTLVERAPGIALPDLDACSDTAALGGVAAAPRAPAVRAAQAGVEARLDRLEAALLGDVSLPQARALTVEASLLTVDAALVGWGPLVARARRALGEVQFQAGQGKAARTTLVGAVAAAEGAGDLDGVVDADLALVETETALNTDFDLADGWATLAEGALARLGPRVHKQLALAHLRGRALRTAGHPGRARGVFAVALALARSRGTKVDELSALTDLASAEGEDGDNAQSRAHAEAALVLAHAELGDHHPRVASIEYDLGAAAIREGHAADAIVHLQRAWSLREELLGADAVPTASAEEALGVAELALDQLDVATTHIEGALAILRARLGDGHPDVANALNDIGGAYHRAGLYERALANAQRTLAMREAALGPDHPDVAQSLVNLAIEAKALERWDLVMPAYRRAIPIMEKAYGPRHFATGVTHLNYAEALRVHGELDAAAVEYARARDAIAGSLGEDSPVLAHVFNGTGQLALARGDTERARPLLERAVELRAQDPSDATALAESRFALAQALPADARARARDLAVAARDAYRDAGKPFTKSRTAIDAWLATHP